MARPIKIAIDVRDLRSAKTGTRTYLEEVCRAFKQLDVNDLRFYFVDTLLPVYSGNNKVLKLIEHIRYQLWKQVGLPLIASIKGCHIVFCTDNVVPLIHLGYKTIPVFHDAFFFESPENYGKIWLWLYKKTAVPAARTSAYVITPSAWSKQQIHRYTGISNDKLVVVPEGPKALKELPHVMIESLKGKSYILHVGSWFKRKNLPALIRAFDSLKSRGAYSDLKLVLTGEAPVSTTESDAVQINEAIARSAFKHDIVLTGYMPDEALSTLYDNALLYVFPSINEGFGIPVLEAFTHRLPVVVADNTCLPEVGGNAVITFNPFDIEDIAGKIKMVLDNENLRDEMIVKGMAQLEKFSWRNTALKLADLFRQAI